MVTGTIAIGFVKPREPTLSRSPSRGTQVAILSSAVSLTSTLFCISLSHAIAPRRCSAESHLSASPTASPTVSFSLSISCSFSLHVFAHRFFRSNEKEREAGRARGRSGLVSPALLPRLAVTSCSRRTDGRRAYDSKTPARANPTRVTRPDVAARTIRK